jgi:thiamine pyrophosphokinase
MNALIIANGTQPPLTIVRPIAQSANLIICADGGANHALKMNIKPHIIIGDFDSILASTKVYYSNVTQRVIGDQDSTDLEKAIRYCIEQQIASVTIIGATGDRLDHTTGTLGCFKKFGDTIDLQLIDSVGALTLIRPSVTLVMKKGETLSLIPLEKCTGVTTVNLKYGLNDDVLELGFREGISNEATAEDVSISVKTGTLLLYRFHP